MSLTKKQEKQNLKGVDLGFHLENMELWDIQLAEADNAYLSGDLEREEEEIKMWRCHPVVVSSCMSPTEGKQSKMKKKSRMKHHRI